MQLTLKLQTIFFNSKLQFTKNDRFLIVFNIRCIQNFLSDQTVILVTHQLQFIEAADKIVVLKDGEALKIGSYKEVLQSGALQFLEHEQDKMKQNNRKSIADSAEFDVASLKELENTISRSRKPSEAGPRTIEQQCSMDAIEKEDDDDENDYDIHETDSRAETRSVGSVKFIVYWNFIRAGATIPFVILIIFMTITPQIIFHYTDLWLASWTRDYEPKLITINGTDGNLTTVYQRATIDSERDDVIKYSSLIVSLFVAAFLRVLCIYLLCLKCSIALHNRIFAKLLRAPLIFFESNPMGRILNRFTRDMGQIDQKVPATLDELVSVSYLLFRMFLV